MRLNIRNMKEWMWIRLTTYHWQKQPTRGVLKKRCSENLQQIYRRTPMPKCDFSKVTLQLYWNHTSAWVVCCKFAVYFQNIFSKEHIWVAASVFTLFSFFTVSNSLWFDLNELLKTPPILEKFFAYWDRP